MSSGCIASSFTSIGRRRLILLLPLVLGYAGTLTWKACVDGSDEKHYSVLQYFCGASVPMAGVIFVRISFNMAGDGALETSHTRQMLSAPLGRGAGSVV